MAKAIYLDTPKGSTTLIHGAGAIAMGAIYFSTHEIANGIVRRSLNKEQLFLSNTAAAVVTNIATFAFLSNRNKAWNKRIREKESQKKQNKLLIFCVQLILFCVL